MTERADNLAPVNRSVLSHAESAVRQVLQASYLGDERAARTLLRFAAAEALEASLKRVAALADQCVPTAEEIRIGRGTYSADAVKLRHELAHIEDVLAQAAGRAVVVDMAAEREARAGIGLILEREGADPSHDSGEFPRAPGCA